MTLRIVSLLGPNVDESAAEMAAGLADRGIDATSAETSHEHRMGLVMSGEADIVWLCGLLALELDLDDFELVAAPSFVGETRTSYRSVVISKSGSDSLEALCGSDTVWAVNEDVSWSGHRALLAECDLRGLPSPSNIVWSGSHLESIRMVHRGDADAAAIDSTLWRWSGADSPHAVDETRPWPSPPLLVRRELGDRAPGLIELISGAEPLGGVSRFELADWSHLDPIRASASR